MIVNGACRSKRCCLALSLLDDSAVVPIKAGRCPIPVGQSRYERDCEAPVRKRPSFAFRAMINPRCEFPGGPLGQRWFGESHRAAHHPSGQSALLPTLDGFGRVCGGIKKVPETSPPGTQQHLVTCSRRGRHNAALATCCYYVSIATKFVLRCGVGVVCPVALLSLFN